MISVKTSAAVGVLLLDTITGNIVLKAALKIKAPRTVEDEAFTQVAIRRGMDVLYQYSGWAQILEMEGRRVHIKTGNG